LIKKLLTKGAVVGFAAIATFSRPNMALAYPVDCAILLCLSGGWPASAECSHARAVFIRRITPWPVEPPLQIWRCPMGLAYNDQPTDPFGNKTFRALLAKQDGHQQYPQSTPESANIVPLVYRPNDGIADAIAKQIAAGDGADIDISDPAFDFVRSIKVWNVMSYSHGPRGRDETCFESSHIQVGTYSEQGAFSWRPTSSGSVPSFVIPRKSCRPSSHTRAVGIEWEDYEGNHGQEVVNY
jgi:hypothetical protein